MNNHSIFKEYYAALPFHDRFVDNPLGAVTVIIPTVHTNELWRQIFYQYTAKFP